MTRKDFEKAVSVFDDAEAFICAAYVEDGLSISVKGPTESVSVGAAQVIIDNAKGSNNPLHHLIVASSLLHSTMLVESQREKDKAIAEAKKKRPKRRQPHKAQMNNISP